MGTKQSNELGIYDMSGNVWEWCWDWYGSSWSGNQQDPQGMSSGLLWVYRDSSWLNDASHSRGRIKRNCSDGPNLK